MQDTVVTALLFGGISFLAAGLALLLTGRFAERVGTGRTAAIGPVFADTPRHYAFREGYLLSPLDPNDVFLPADTDRSAAFDTLARGLAALNPELPSRLAALSERAEAFALTGRFGHDALSIAGRAEEDRLIVTVGPTDGSGRQVIEDRVLHALQSETAQLREAVDLGVAAIWKTDAGGRITWANGPYLELVGRLSGNDPAAVPWPVPDLFADQLEPSPEQGSIRRCGLLPPTGDSDAADGSDPANGKLWFEVSALYHDDQSILFCAQPVDRLVAAETALRNFVQTLSKTFAHLPIGLAIFDKRRELMLFNPALVTLSTLSVEFLSRRPGLVAFLDALRDNQRMPEPKNYRSWRDEIAQLEARAEQGTYQELWTIPTGQSFRVIGRPHPDGAVAFMFEDISSEVSLTRKFRADLDLYQSVLDDGPGALAVFSGDGRLALANAGYAALWSVDPAEATGVQPVTEAARGWQAKAEPSGVWGDIRDFVSHEADRTAWSEEIVLRDGRRFIVQVSPLAAGASAVRFLHANAETGAGIAGGLRPDWSAVVPTLPDVGGMAAPRAEFRSRRIAED